MPDYLQHGRRHAPGGSDPIPGLQGTSYIAGNLTVASLASGSGDTQVSLDPSSASWGTDAGASTASEYFDLRQSGGTGNYALAILQNGLYVLDVSALMTTNGSPSAGSVGEITVSNDFTIGGTDTDLWKARTGGSQVATPSRRSWLNWPPSSGTPPIYHFVSIGQNSGVTVTFIMVSFMAVRIGDGNTGF